MTHGEPLWAQGTLSVFRVARLHNLFLFLRGILVPGGFGTRGTEGMLLAIKYAREQKIPFLGICLGFQLAVIEWARNVMGISGQLSHYGISSKC